jgi:transcriptional regulator with XRE-family HTH domain
MPRRALPSSHFVARVRAWFGLRQEELAVYLGVSASLVRAWEAQRRAPGPDALATLLPLLAQLPLEEASAPQPAAVPAQPALALPSGTAPPDAAALDFRRRQCQQQGARLRAQADALARRAQVSVRWSEALPALLAARPAAPALISSDTAAHAAWQTDWLHRRARPLPPEAVTRWHRLQARIAALDTEAAVLAAALPTAG